MSLPLDGLRVLDATSNIAGPYGATILGDLGADVTKIEAPNGDPSRSMSPLEGDRSAYFHIVNRNKEVIALDLKSPDGKEKLFELLDQCDVFLTNFLPPRLASLGLLPADLMAARPRLIIGNLSSYGAQGPSTSWPGYDATVQARTGIMHVTGEADGEPVRTGVSVLDIGSGTWLALGILAAVIERDKSGKGSLIETSLYETGVMWVSYHLAANAITGAPSARSGSQHPTFAPYGIFQTKDGDICIGVGNDNIFALLATALDRSDLISDKRFARNVDRVTNSKVLGIEINRALSRLDAGQWIQLLAERGVPADVVVPPEALLSDPQAQSIEILIDYPDNESALRKIPGLPIRINGKRPQVRKSAPHKPLI
jgi:crotonobetainyl-CoA:carnitine CoA-transferase CaiB-like acyl-CoA transferase